MDNLIKLHETDERLLEINELKGGLPELVNKEEQELNLINETQLANQNKLGEIDVQLKTNQNSLDDSSNKLEKYNDQLFNVSNNKEYEALISETDQLKDVISDLKNQVTVINDQKIELEQSIEENQKLIEDLNNSISNNKKILSEKMAETDKEEQLLLKNKDNVLKSISADLVQKYNKLFDKYGQGMASISRNACTHCYTSLPPQLIVEVQHDKKVISCPSCSVFLYYKNEEN